MWAGKTQLRHRVVDRSVQRCPDKLTVFYNPQWVLGSVTPVLELFTCDQIMQDRYEYRV